MQKVIVEILLANTMGKNNAAVNNGNPLSKIFKLKVRERKITVLKS